MIDTLEKKKVHILSNCVIAQRKRKMILLHDNARPYVAKVIKDYWYFNRKSYHTSRMCVPLHIITYFYQCSTSTSKHMNKLKKWLDEWIALKDEHFLSRNSLIARKVRKSYNR